ncbi:hypothetical protein TRFO_32079 [Tritrichomonas foetus]|uniref:Uncharacterized protein n=1 Tax=Tritrichomonas foetus TaxID=1144522 RepID=A0A1J4JPV6_9EUKA|nr:hypothetical protein TRFO_32079 [Tritrichomonas foetus]|eukprot:OHT01191.1 hypothetical protein TRFO_32079 [Tritrichomonas foetus]
MNAGQQNQDPKYTETGGLIKSTLMCIDDNFNLLTGRQESLDIMMKQCNDLQFRLSQSELNYEKMNETLKNDIESFRQTIPKKITLLENDQNDLERQLQLLENEKKHLVLQANQLTTEFKQIQLNIQKVSTIADNFQMKQLSPPPNFDEDELDKVRNNCRQMINKIGEVTQQITSFQNSLYQYDSSCVQNHMLYLKEIEVSYKIQRQMNDQHFFSYQKIESQKYAINQIKSEEDYAEKDKQKYTLEIENLKQIIEQNKKNESVYEDRVNSIMDEITNVKKLIYQKKNELKNVENLIENYYEKKMKHRKNEDSYINDKRGQINNIHQTKTQIGYMIRKQKREISRLNMEEQHCELMLINYVNETSEEHNRKIEIQDNKKQLKLKAKTKEDKFKHAEQEIEKLRMEYNTILEQIEEQKNIHYQLKIHKVDAPKMPDTPRKIFRRFTTNINTLNEEIEAKKNELSHSTLKYKFMLKKRNAFMSRIAAISKETTSLEKQLKEAQDARYYLTCGLKHDDLVAFKSLNDAIDDIALRVNHKKKKIKRKKKLLIRVIAENGVQNLNGSYQANDIDEYVGPTDREKNLHHIIEHQKEIIDKIENIKQILDLRLPPIVLNSVISDWDEFIDKKTATL